MVALHCVSSGEFSPTLLRGAVDSAMLCRSPVCFVVNVYIYIYIYIYTQNDLTLATAANFATARFALFWVPVTVTVI